MMTYAEDPDNCLCRGWEPAAHRAKHHPCCRAASDPSVYEHTAEEALAIFGPYFPSRKNEERPLRPRPMSRPYSRVCEDAASAMVSMYEGGATIRQVAEVLSRNPSTVHHILTRRGVRMRPRGATP